MNETNKPAVALDHVSKSFGNRQILSDLSLSVTPGQALCILGRSGTGKSVTLKLMIALLRPDGGQIRIAGDNIAELEGEQLSHVRRKMGFLFRGSSHIQPKTSVKDFDLTLIQWETRIDAWLLPDRAT